MPRGHAKERPHAGTASRGLPLAGLGLDVGEEVVSFGVLVLFAYTGDTGQLAR